jgi:hypothetical protein
MHLRAALCTHVGVLSRCFGNVVPRAEYDGDARATTLATKSAASMPGPRDESLVVKKKPVFEYDTVVRPSGDLHRPHGGDNRDVRQVRRAAG